MIELRLKADSGLEGLKLCDLRGKIQGLCAYLRCSAR